MKRRPLGRSDLSIAPLVLGGNVFGWTANRDAAFLTLDTFLDAGFNAVDTADVYSNWVAGHVGGESETVIGEWLRARGGRDRVVLCTKAGARTPEGEGLSADHLVRSLEGSLRRLNTDYVDLYQSHVDDRTTPLDETLEAFDRLLRAGKVRAIGASHYGAARLNEALAISAARGVARYDSLQPRYNLHDRAEFEGPVQDACVAGDVGVLAYSALAKGFLTGKFRSGAASVGSPYEERLNTYRDARGVRILAALDRVAEVHAATPAEVALTWLVAQPGVVAAITAFDTADQLKEVIGFPRLTLAASEIETLSAAGALETCP
ncbi:MAG TPA: aldo/keto reductase [Caulobacteraceae bacterium]|jgi:aryl-alcohol dehydrogenase-like predicted oxidoreductase|nr:aldo/keto reductase [Caulobacteraceae bacterium]